MFSRRNTSGSNDDGKDGKGGKKNQKAAPASAPAESSKTGGRHKLSGKEKKGNSKEPSEEVMAKIKAAGDRLKERLKEEEDAEFKKAKEDAEFEKARNWYAGAELAPEDRALRILSARKAAPPIDPSAVAVSPDAAVARIVFPEAPNDSNIPSRKGHHPRHSSSHKQTTGSSSSKRSTSREPTKEDGRRRHVG